jgi:hypothetical protein
MTSTTVVSSDWMAPRWTVVASLRRATNAVGKLRTVPLVGSNRYLPAHCRKIAVLPNSKKKAS